MYYVISEHGVMQEKTIAKLNKKYKINMSESDFTPKGNDFIVKTTNEDMEYIKDLNRISEIPIGKLFKTDSAGKMIMYIILAMQFILLVKK